MRRLFAKFGRNPRSFTEGWKIPTDVQRRKSAAAAAAAARTTRRRRYLLLAWSAGAAVASSADDASVAGFVLPPLASRPLRRRRDAVVAVARMPRSLDSQHPAIGAVARSASPAHCIACRRPLPPTARSRCPLSPASCSKGSSLNPAAGASRRCSRRRSCQTYLK